MWYKLGMYYSQYMGLMVEDAVAEFNVEYRIKMCTSAYKKTTINHVCFEFKVYPVL